MAGRRNNRKPNELIVMISLQGKIALVTGASRGIGAAIAQELAREGASVIVTHRASASDAEKIVSQLSGSGHRAIKADATDSSALASLTAHVKETNGHLDILINNAGYSQVVKHADLDSLQDDLFDLIMRTNVRGPFATIRACRELLEKGTDGHVVNISSIAANINLGSNIAYCASKAALNSLTASVGRALAPKIRVNAVAPGLVDTEFTKTWEATVRNAQLAETPLGRFATTQDVATTVIGVLKFFPLTTGAVFPVDGGRMLGRQA